MELDVKFETTPFTETANGTEQTTIPAGTWKAIWSSPAQHPDRPWYRTLAGVPPIMTDTRRLVRLTGVGGARDSSPGTAPKPVLQIVRISPGFAEWPLVISWYCGSVTTAGPNPPSLTAKTPKEFGTTWIGCGGLVCPL